MENFIGDKYLFVEFYWYGKCLEYIFKRKKIRLDNNIYSRILF